VAMLGKEPLVFVTDRHLNNFLPGSETLPAHSLKPFPGPLQTGKTKNGIMVFSSSKHSQSETFLTENEASLALFADVLESLCVGVFGLKVGSIAIYHDPVGVTIAFNRNRALHFNFRYFHSIHYLHNKWRSADCYSYWFVIIWYVTQYMY
jgi:hypothetical protein